MVRPSLKRGEVKKTLKDLIEETSPSMTRAEAGKKGGRGKKSNAAPAKLSSSTQRQVAHLKRDHLESAARLGAGDFASVEPSAPGHFAPSW
jgi:hypothetical protein